MDHHFVYQTRGGRQEETHLQPNQEQPFWQTYILTILWCYLITWTTRLLRSFAKRQEIRGLWWIHKINWLAAGTVARVKEKAEWGTQLFAWKMAQLHPFTPSNFWKISQLVVIHAYLSPHLWTGFDDCSPRSMCFTMDLRDFLCQEQCDVRQLAGLWKPPTSGAQRWSWCSKAWRTILFNVQMSRKVFAPGLARIEPTVNSLVSNWKKKWGFEVDSNALWSWPCFGLDRLVCLGIGSAESSPSSVPSSEAHGSTKFNFD